MQQVHSFLRAADDNMRADLVTLATASRAGQSTEKSWRDFIGSVTKATRKNMVVESVTREQAAELSSLFGKKKRI